MSIAPPSCPLSLALRKLESYGRFTDDDRGAFLSLPYLRQPTKAGTQIVLKGDVVRSCRIVIAGFAYRFKMVADGGRQIIAIHMAGDLLDLQHALMRVATHNVQMLTPGELAVIRMEPLEELARQRPAVQRALWLDTLIDGSIFSEWIANVGRRNARTRISHLLCEFATRMRAMGLIAANSYELPMTQEQLADATGLTPVHVNRVLQDLRRSGLIKSDRRTITIDDWQALSETGDFDPSYLRMPMAMAA